METVNTIVRMPTATANRSNSGEKEHREEEHGKEDHKCQEHYEEGEVGCDALSLVDRKREGRSVNRFCLFCLFVRLA